MKIRPRRYGWTTLIALNVACWCVLGFYQSPGWAQRRREPPFANAIEQRRETIELLKKISAQLEFQNTLLRSGQLKVIAVDQKQ